MSTAPVPPLWFLAPGAMPVRSDARRIPDGATHQACERDAAWTPLGTPRTPRTPRMPAGEPAGARAGKRAPWREDRATGPLGALDEVHVPGEGPEAEEAVE